MTQAINLRHQDYQFEQRVPAGVWRWTTRMDVSSACVIFQVLDLQTPWGLYRDSIPIPGDIVTAMHDSIVQLKANFKPTILMGPPPSLVFDVDEGRGLTLPQEVLITNSGVFGSMLSASLISSASYLRVTPTLVGNLASNEGGTFSALVDSTNLNSVLTPYSETITVQDTDATNSPQVFPVTINVRPKAVFEVVPATLLFTVTKPAGGPFPTLPTQTFLVRNTGPAASVLDYQVQALTCIESWLSGWSPVSGTVLGGFDDLVTVSVQPPDDLTPGTYETILRVSGYSSNGHVDVTIILIVS